jgi:hypothetical protein
MIGAGAGLVLTACAFEYILENVDNKNNKSNNLKYKEYIKSYNKSSNDKFFKF